MKKSYSFGLCILFCISIQPATAQYCTPPNYLSGPYTGITNVIFSPIVNSTAYNDGYTDYSTTQIATVTAGTNKILSLSFVHQMTGGSFSDSLELRVWIDWNQDFDFTDPGEEMVNEVVDLTSGSATVSYNLAIPFTATSGTTRMRVYEDMLEGDGHSNPDPCGYSTGLGQHGECEDYGITVIASTEPPVASFTSLNLGGGLVSFTDESTNSPTSWAWVFDDGNTSTEQNPSNTYAAVGVSYNICLTATNANGSGNTCNYVLVTAAAGIHPLMTGAQDLQIVPNPVNGEGDVHLFFKGRVDASVVRVYDITGRELLTYTIPGGAESLKMKVEDLGTGVYFVRWEDTNNNSLTKKLVVAQY